MNKKMLSICAAVVILGSILFAACKEEEDHDLIVGKWRNKAVLEVPENIAQPCTKASYIEFTDYVLNDKDRKFFDVNKCADTIKTRTYRVNSDTIKIVNERNELTQYIIISIDGESMVYKDLSDRLFYWQRYQ